MEAALIIKLIAEVGLPLADRLIAGAQAGEKITPEQWAELRQLARYTSADALAKAEGARIPRS